MTQKERLELEVLPVGYHNENFDKFDYYLSIGSWSMAEQLFRDLEQRLKEAEEVIEVIERQCSILLGNGMTCGNPRNILASSIISKAQEYLNKYGTKK